MTAKAAASLVLRHWIARYGLAVVALLVFASSLAFVGAPAGAQMDCDGDGTANANANLTTGAGFVACMSDMAGEGIEKVTPIWAGTLAFVVITGMLIMLWRRLNRFFKGLAR